MNKLISICIPTYNRGRILEDSLAHITSEKIFLETNDIEIVVADNASPDNTQEICERFAAKFPDKFIYHRQNQNLGTSKNMTTLMELAHGNYIKFLNDNFFFLPGKLEDVCRLIRQQEKDAPVLSFGSGHAPYCPHEVVRVESHNQMLELLSYYATWLGGFGFWQKDLNKALAVHKQYSDTLLPQVVVLWELFDDKRKGVIDNRELYDEKYSQISKGGYNVAEVFSKVYLGMIKNYVGENKISEAAYEKEKKRLFYDYLFFRYNDFLHANSFSKGHWFAYTADFHGNLYYWVSFLYWPICKFASLLPKRLRYMSKDVFLKLKSLLSR